MAHSLSNLGLVAWYQGDYQSARTLFEESLTIRRELGDRAGAAVSLNNLGNALLVQGKETEALASFRESLAIEQELVDRWGIAYSLEGIAAASASLGQSLLAARIWGAAEMLREEIGAPISQNDRRHYEIKVAEARDAEKDDTLFDAAWQQGRALSLGQAIELAFNNAPNMEEE